MSSIAWRTAAASAKDAPPNLNTSIAVAREAVAREAVEPVAAEPETVRERRGDISRRKGVQSDAPVQRARGHTWARCTLLRAGSPVHSSAHWHSFRQRSSRDHSGLRTGPVFPWI